MALLCTSRGRFNESLSEDVAEHFFPAFDHSFLLLSTLPWLYWVENIYFCPVLKGKPSGV